VRRRMLEGRGLARLRKTAPATPGQLASGRRKSNSAVRMYRTFSRHVGSLERRIWVPLMGRGNRAT